MAHAHIIGSGLAGLSAAVALTKAGHGVTLYESGPAAGGRCRSYFDRELGCRIDNGNHLLLSGNRAALDYLATIGAADTLSGPTAPLFPFMDLATGERWTVAPNMGRIPWWVLSAARGVRGARLSEFAALLKLKFARGDQTAARTDGGHQRFNPRPALSRGATGDGDRTGSHYVVSIRAPRFRAGRLARHRPARQQRRVSIRAPRFRAGRHVGAGAAESESVFQSAPRAFARGDRHQYETAAPSVTFQSAPRAFARGDTRIRLT